MSEIGGYMRVYQDTSFNRKGEAMPWTLDNKKNFINHQKVYKFASQFVKKKIVGDIGCGSGHGSTLLNKAKKVYGSDISSHAIEFAKKMYKAEFSVQDISALKYKDNQFDVAICSEVLEHTKEKADKALEEIKRVTNGLIIIGTPNSELLGPHGYYFNEINALMARHFKEYCIFENALVGNKTKWESRLAQKQTGIIVSQDINFDETVIQGSKQIKTGIQPGKYQFGDTEIDTTLLHNTHSWMIVALNKKYPKLRELEEQMKKEREDNFGLLRG
jgi:2-polyprenyl-3-methyl-5-hydroxy-6-metoxy-1,4-benzoquinol methylase